MHRVIPSLAANSRNFPDHLRATRSKRMPIERAVAYSETSGTRGSRGPCRQCRTRPDGRQSMSLTFAVERRHWATRPTHTATTSARASRRTRHMPFWASQAASSTRHSTAVTATPRPRTLVRELVDLPKSCVPAAKSDRDMETDRPNARRARQSDESCQEELGVNRLDILHLRKPECRTDPLDVSGPGRDTRLATLHAGSGPCRRLQPRHWKPATDDQHPFRPDIRGHAQPKPLRAIGPHEGRRSCTRLCDLRCGTSGERHSRPRQCRNTQVQPPGHFGREPCRECAIAKACAWCSAPAKEMTLRFSQRGAKAASTIYDVSNPEQVRQTEDRAEAQMLDGMWTELAAISCGARNPPANPGYLPC